MKASITRISTVLSCVVLFAGLAQAQVSGVPGDGIPDVYYFDALSGAATTSMGDVTRPAGTLLVDTDGADMIAILVGGPDVTANCELCEGGFLPDPNAAPFFVSSWSQGFINGTSQWIRTAPLSGDGFSGVIGEGDDFASDPAGPTGILPDFGLGNYGEGAAFDKVLVDDNGGMWSVTFATNASGTFFTDVTTVPAVPEPAGLALLVMAALGVFVGRRR